MTVSVDDGGKACGFGFDVELLEDVEDVNGHTLQCENLRQRNLSCPGFTIDVPAHCCYGSDVRQRFENSCVANVTGMDDVRGSP